MVRKISGIVIAIVAVATGVYACHKLGYWHRSTAIFESVGSERDGQGPGGFERHGDGRMHGNGQGFRARIFADSLRMNAERAGSSERPMRRFEGQGHGAAYSIKRINLRSVIWFLPVFAGFSTVAIWLDKWYSFSRRRRARKCRT